MSRPSTHKDKTVLVQYIGGRPYKPVDLPYLASTEDQVEMTVYFTAENNHRAEVPERFVDEMLADEDLFRCHDEKEAARRQQLSRVQSQPPADVAHDVPVQPPPPPPDKEIIVVPAKSSTATPLSQFEEFL